MDYKERYHSPHHPSHASPLTLSRLSHFRRIVNSSEEQTVDIHRLASLALRGHRPPQSPLLHEQRLTLACVGIPDENSLRPRTWKLLLHLIPAAKKDWDGILYEKRCQYYVHSFLFTENAVLMGIEFCERVTCRTRPK